MKNTNFSMLDQLNIPSYERMFRDINLCDIFSAEEIEKYSLKKITLLAIMSDIEKSMFDIPDHLHIVMVSVSDVKFNKYLYNIYKKVTAYCKSICLVIFEKNGVLKIGNCFDLIHKGSSIICGDIVFTQWLFEDYITPEVYAFLYEFKRIINSEDPVASIYLDLYDLFYTLQSEFLTEEQVKGQLYKNYRKLCKSPLFRDYVLSTSFSTYRHTEGYEPRLRYEKSSVLRACDKFVA